jgi:hypothetical protein
VTAGPTAAGFSASARGSRAPLRRAAQELGTCGTRRKSGGIGGAVRGPARPSVIDPWLRQPSGPGRLVYGDQTAWGKEGGPGERSGLVQNVLTAERDVIVFDGTGVGYSSGEVPRVASLERLAGAENPATVSPPWSRRALRIA